MDNMNMDDMFDDDMRDEAEPMHSGGTGMENEEAAQSVSSSETLEEMWTAADPVASNQSPTNSLSSVESCSPFYHFRAKGTMENIVYTLSFRRQSEDGINWSILFWTTLRVYSKSSNQRL